MSAVPPPDREPIHLGYLGSIFIVFGLIGLLTSFILGQSAAEIFSGTVKYAPAAADPVDPVGPLEPGEGLASLDYGIIGPFEITRPGQSIWISLAAPVPVNQWLFIEGELLDSDQNYLMGFGSELWHETGYDDSYWEETHNEYNINLTMPEVGRFYLNLKTQGQTRPNYIAAKISRTNGSSVPHLIFGVLSLLIGIVMNEMSNHTIARFIEVLNERRNS